MLLVMVNNINNINNITNWVKTTTKTVPVQPPLDNPQWQGLGQGLAQDHLKHPEQPQAMCLIQRAAWWCLGYQEHPLLSRDLTEKLLIASQKAACKRGNRIKRWSEMPSLSWQPSKIIYIWSLLPHCNWYKINLYFKLLKASNMVQLFCLICQWKWASGFWPWVVC